MILSDVLNCTVPPLRVESSAYLNTLFHQCSTLLTVRSYFGIGFIDKVVQADQLTPNNLR
jgi:hypothetical protein